MKKVHKDGMVAVLYSPGFGAGWSTWSDSKHRAMLCMDADIVQCVIDGDKEKASEIASSRVEGFYGGGAHDLRVEWLKQGSVFIIEEYDGSETIHVIGDREYLTA